VGRSQSKKRPEKENKKHGNDQSIGTLNKNKQKGARENQ
jgi:hypothetical protein